MNGTEGYHVCSKYKTYHSRNFFLSLNDYRIRYVIIKNNKYTKMEEKNYHKNENILDIDRFHI